MKKIKTSKITLLFLLFLCVFSAVFIGVRRIYLKTNQSNFENNVEKLLELYEKQENIKEKIIFEDEEVGLIIIPSLDIKAPIKEGTDSNILKYSVGHFKETPIWNGNVALASHNRGSYAHYFSRINELKNGEEIIYITNMGERRYEVTENKIIEETNVEILENTEENIITLITCVTGKRDKRQCIIGKEINSI